MIPVYRLSPAIWWRLFRSRCSQAWPPGPGASGSGTNPRAADCSGMHLWLVSLAVGAAVFIVASAVAIQIGLNTALSVALAAVAAALSIAWILSGGSIE
jgi:hypothetical protein